MAAAVAAILLIGHAGPVQAGVTAVWEAGPSANRVNAVFLGDGYTASEIGTAYASHVDAALDHIFSAGEEPFVRYRNFFNAYRVDVVSQESGADVPPGGIYVDTALDATYYGDGVTERLLTISTTKANHAAASALDGTGISTDMRFVSVNSTRYGGSGGTWAVFAGGNAWGGELALHETGHGFAGLADEYGGYTSTYAGSEPPEPNVTRSSAGEKWERWIGYEQPGIGTIGAYEGARYYDHGLYRPSQNSKMRSLGQPFDAVAREQFILGIYDLVDPLDAWLDESGTLVDPASLWVDVIDPAVIGVEWLIDGVVVAGAAGETFIPEDWLAEPGVYTVTARAFDATDWVRLDRGPLEESVSWTVDMTHLPEPATVALMALGGVGLVFTRRRPA
jgi:hypothetical protein